MKLRSVAVLGFVVGSVQLTLPIQGAGGGIQIAEYFANYTYPATTPHTTNDTVSISADGPPPPIPPRPAPKPPGESYLSLYASASDDVWDKARCKGANFVRAMRGTDEEAGSVFNPPRGSAAAEFEDIEDLQKWGWDYSLDKHVGTFDKWGMDRILRELGVSDKCFEEKGSIHCLTFIHGDPGMDEDGNWVSVDQQTYEVNGKTYRMTGAHYGLGFEPDKGVIIAMDRNSPQSAGKDRTPVMEGDDLPALRACSDVAWLSWKQFGGDVKNLKKVLSLSITNQETQAIMSRAIRSAVPGAQSFPAWGGYTFRTDTPEGQAILGTPNAHTFSYFLLQHKSSLSNMYISQVQVFRDDRRRPGPNLLLIVEPVPEGEDADKPQTVGETGRMRRRIHRPRLQAKL